MKKRFLSLLLALTLACSLLVFPANAAEVVDSGTCGENVTWVFTDDGVLTISGTGPMTDYSDSSHGPWYGNGWGVEDIVIRDVEIEPGVTSIGSFVFDNCVSLESVTIPDSVTSIGQYAFKECRRLNGVTIPDSVTSIGNYTFYNCSSLTNVTIPDSVTSIGYYAFYGCSSLTSVTIPDSVTSIGDSVFSGCSSLTDVTVPDSVTSIGDSAFSGCSGLTSVTIPDSVTSIGDNAFSNCSSLTSVAIPESITRIGRYAFSGCSSLTSATIPDSVTNIGWNTFEGCSSLESVNILARITDIPSGAFSGCSSLTSVTIPDGISSIGNSAFCGCKALKSIEIRSFDLIIYDHAFAYCTSLENVRLAVKNYAYIGNYAFQGNTNLENIQFPNSLQLGSYAFDGCTGLTSITIPSITTIPERAFQNCTGLESLTIESGLKTIDNYAFLGCSALKTVTLPDSLTNVNTGAFRNCNSIANVYYGGNSTQWAAINIKSYNEPLTGASIHYSGSAPAKIESDPSDVLTTAGKPATFTVVASGDIASYQWQVKTTSGSWKNSTAPGCTTDTMRTTATAARDGYQYRCIVTDVDGNVVISEPATLRVVAPVAITGSPMNCVGKAGQIASFAVSAEGEGLTYQWQLSDDGGETWKNSSVKSAIYSTKMTEGRNGRMVRCVVTDQFGNSAVSDAAVMRLKNPLVITKLPQNYVGQVNSTASFFVTAQGSGLSYQWQYSDNGTKWSNSSVKSAVYSTKLTASRDGRMVRCIVTDQFGNSVTSAPASMKIG